MQQLNNWSPHAWNWCLGRAEEARLQNADGLAAVMVDAAVEVGQLEMRQTGGKPEVVSNNGVTACFWMALADALKIVSPDSVSLPNHRKRMPS